MGCPLWAPFFKELDDSSEIPIFILKFYLANTLITCNHNILFFSFSAKYFIKDYLIIFL